MVMDVCAPPSILSIVHLIHHRSNPFQLSFFQGRRHPLEVVTGFAYTKHSRNQSLVVIIFLRVVSANGCTFLTPASRGGRSSGLRLFRFKLVVDLTAIVEDLCAITPV